MKELERVAAEVAATRKRWAEAVTRRDELIRKLLPTVGATALGRVAGLTRERIYQIAAHRR